MAYTGPNRLKPGEKFLTCRWTGGAITKRKGFKTIEGARRYAERELVDPAVHEVAILVKDKSNKDWPWRVIERHKNQARERLREAAKREAQEARAARGRKRS